MIFPDTPEQLVLNGILHPDSTVRIYITKSTSVTDVTQRLPSVTDAKVQLYEGDLLLGALEYQRDAYEIDYLPVPGRVYTIEVSVGNYPTVSASDTVPLALQTKACYKPQTRYPDATIAVQATVEDNSEEEDYYWLSLLVRRYEQLDSIRCIGENEQRSCSFNDSSTTSIRRLSYLYTDSPEPDNFNSNIDNLSGGLREFNSFVRLDDIAINGTTIELDLTSHYPMFGLSDIRELDDSQSLMLEVVNASSHYDRYLKSSAIYYLNNEFGDDGAPNPFAEPTRIYSNVENGLGIFAAYNSVSIAVEQFPCE